MPKVLTAISTCEAMAARALRFIKSAQALGWLQGLRDFIMRAAFAVALGVGAALVLYRINANASAVDNPDETLASDIQSFADVPFFQTEPGGSMQLSDQGLERIKAREGFNPNSYPDASGRSIGYGHFIKPGESFDEPMSVEDATALLYTDAADAVAEVNRDINVILTQNQFDALVSFVYNIGDGKFRSSTMRKKINAGDFAGAADEFYRWNHANGEESQALNNRRADERGQFLA